MKKNSQIKFWFFQGVDFLSTSSLLFVEIWMVWRVGVYINHCILGVSPSWFVRKFMEKSWNVYWNTYQLCYDEIFDESFLNFSNFYFIILVFRRSLGTTRRGGGSSLNNVYLMWSKALELERNIYIFKWNKSNQKVKN